MSEEDSIIREVEEDLRRERYERLWKKYGPFVIGTVAVVLVSMLGWQQWQAYQERQRAKEAETFLAAIELLEDGKEAAAANAFGELAGKAGPGYRAVARMHEAEAYLEQGNPDRALNAFDALAKDGSVNPKLRALAALKGAFLLADSASPTELKKRLAAPLRPGSPWRFAAQEVVAYAHYRAGQFGEARNAYQTLVNEYDAPSYIRDRARNMLALIASEEAQGSGGEAEEGTIEIGDAPDSDAEASQSAGGGDEAADAQETEEGPVTDDTETDAGAATEDAADENAAENADDGVAENGAQADETGTTAEDGE